MTHDDIVNTITKALYAIEMSGHKQAMVNPDTSTFQLKYLRVKIGNYEVCVDKIPSKKMDMQDNFVVAITSDNHLICSNLTPTPYISDIIQFAAKELMRVENEINGMLVTDVKE